MIADLDLIDIKTLNKLINETYSIDFGDYATTSYKRRVEKAGNSLHISTFDVLLDKIKTDVHFFERFCSNMVVDTTEFFRDPSFWRKIREEVLSKFKSNNTVRIWMAGCSTGEELLTLAIILKEEGLYDKCKILATEINDIALMKVKNATYDSKSLETAESNYERYEGKKKLADYYTEINGEISFKQELLSNVNFQAKHLDDQTSSSKFDLILCRNILIYFNQALQDRVLQNFSNSLFPNGFLALGVKESIERSKSNNDFIIVSTEENILKKK